MTRRSFRGRYGGTEPTREDVRGTNDDCDHDADSTFGSASTGSIYYDASRSVVSSVVGHDDPTAVIRNSYSRVRSRERASTPTSSTIHSMTIPVKSESRNPENTARTVDGTGGVVTSIPETSDVAWREQLSELDRTQEQWKARLPIHLKRHLPCGDHMDIMEDTMTAETFTHENAPAKRARLSVDTIEEERKDNRFCCLSNTSADDSINSMEEAKSHISTKQPTTNGNLETAEIVRQVVENNEIIRQVQKRLTGTPIPEEANTDISTDESSHEEEMDSRGINKCLIIVITILILLTITSGVAVYFVKSKDKENPAAEAVINDGTFDQPSFDTSDPTEAPIQVIPTLNPTMEQTLDRTGTFQPSTLSDEVIHSVLPTAAPILPTTAPILPTTAPILPTTAPIIPPTVPIPTAQPTISTLTEEPIEVIPTLIPATENPSLAPVEQPTQVIPTLGPVTQSPSISPVAEPIQEAPTSSPQTKLPSLAPVTTDSPTLAPLETSAPVANTPVPTPAPVPAPLIPVTSDPTSSPTDMPTLSPTDMPTMHPTDAVTSNPTNTATLSPTYTRRPDFSPIAIFQRLLAVIYPLSGVKLYDPSSPQFKAIQWMEKEDPLRANIAMLPDAIVLERYVAVVLYFAMNGEDWNDSYGFLGEENVCEWHNDFDGTGLFCTAEGLVESIVFDGNNLDGVMPDELKALTALTTLELTKNRIFGTLPEKIGEIVGLQILDLRQNQLHGTIPEGVFRLGSLRELVLLGNGMMTGFIPSVIGHATNLEVLSLQDCSFYGSLPETMSTLSSLRYISILNNGITGFIPQGISNLQNLEVLELSRNYLTGPIPEFAGQSSLSIISLDDNMLMGSVPSSLGSLSGLRFLDISSNSFLEGQIPADIGTLPLLGSFLASYNRLEGTLPFFTGMLQTIEIASNNLSGDLDSIFNVAGPYSSLRSVRLNSNHFRGGIPEAITLFTELNYLILNSNNIAGSIPHSIISLSALEVLAIKSNELVGTLPEELGLLDSLIVLDLGSNHISGTIPDVLSHLTDLSMLDLSSNRISGQIHGSFLHLNNLESLHLDDNDLTGTLDPIFCHNNEGAVFHIIDAFASDCGGNEPEVLCTCCSECCIDGGFCQPN